MNLSMSKSAIARRSVLGFALGCGVLHAAPLARDVLARPALAVGKPERAVLLGAATAGKRLVAVGERGIIVYSDDLGASWKQAPSPVSATLTSVRFADAQRGVAVGHGGTVLTTGDGGLSWTLRLEGRRVAALVQEAASRRGDPALAEAAQRLIKEGPDKPFLDVHMIDRDRMELVGAYGLALATTDAGRAVGGLDGPARQPQTAAPLRGASPWRQDGLGWRGGDGLSLRRWRSLVHQNSHALSRKLPDR
jgi:photosystem II stability/assembly factor-like uncharacterized protein